MVRLAEELHPDHPKCKSWLNDTNNLTKFSDDYFGFIYTSITLEHIPAKYAVSCLLEFDHVLRLEGMVVFQVANSDRTSALTRVRNFIGSLRTKNRLLGRRESVSFKMAMCCLPENEVRSILTSTDLQVVDVKFTNSTDESFNGHLRFLDRESAASLAASLHSPLDPTRKGLRGSRAFSD